MTGVYKAIKDKNPRIVYETIDEETGTKKEKFIARYIKVVKAKRSLETEQMTLELEFFYLGKFRKIEIQRAHLSRYELLKLKGTGLDITESNVYEVLQALEAQEGRLKPVITYSTMGWEKVDQKMVYKHHSLVNEKGKSAPGLYVGDYSIEPKGDKALWEALIKEDVLPHTELTFALALGFSAPLVSYLKDETDIPVLFYHFNGGSTTGKTTAVQLAVSPFGLPLTRSGGLLLKWNGTQNGIIGSMADLHGIPLALDESSLAGLKDFTNFIYTVAEGIEKDRMNRDLTNRIRRTWSGTTISTGEASIIGKSNKNSGLGIRLAEIQVAEWTKSAEHSTRIKKGVLQNHGHQGIEFVQFIIRKGKDTVLDEYESAREEVLERLEIKDQFTERLVDRTAIIALTLKYMEACFGWDVRYENVLGFIIEQDQVKAGKRDVGEVAYDYVKEKVLQKWQHFEIKGTNPKYDYYGRIELNERNDDGLTILFLPTALRTLLDEGGFEDAQVILKSWRDRGFVDGDHGKLTRKRNIKSMDKKGNIKPPSRMSLNIVNVNDKDFVEAVKKLGSIRDLNIGQPKQRQEPKRYTNVAELMANDIRATKKLTPLVKPVKKVIK